MTQKTEVRIVKLEDAYKAIMEKLKEMNERMVGVDHVIRGNGRPGLVTEVETLKQSVKDLKGARKDWKDFMVMIAGGGIVAVITALVQHFAR